MKFKIDHDKKEVFVSSDASFEVLMLAKQSAKNHGYELVILWKK